MRLNKIESVKGIHRRPDIVLGLPTLGIYPAKVFIAFSRLQMPVNALSTTILVENMEIGEARNYIAKSVKNNKTRPHYLLFIGEDMLPQWDSLVLLHEEAVKGQWDVLAGLYYMKADPPTAVAWRQGVPGPLVPGKHFKKDEVVQVDVCGMDFTLINTDIFDIIDEPFFKTGPEINKLGGIYKYTEDTYFLEKCRKKNLKIGVHTGVRIGHLYYKTGEVY